MGGQRRADENGSDPDQTRGLRPPTSEYYLQLKYLIGMRSKKKLAYLRTLSQLSLPSPPLSPIRTYLNWDIFEHCYPSPPLLQLGQFAFQIFFGHEF